MSSHNRTDVIVIGSGLGGLSCALHLAKKGLSVTVLEKQPKVGGYAQNFHRSGYDFDVSLHLLPSMNKGAGLHKLLKYLQVLDKLKVEEHTPMFTSVFPDTTYKLPGKKEAAHYLKSVFPDEAAGIDGYIDAINRIVSDNGKLFWDGDIDLKNFYPAQYFKQTYQQLLDRFFTNPKISGLLGQLWQSTGLPNTMCAANWSAEVFGSHLITGNYYVQGGGQAISNAMTQTLFEAGCKVYTSSLVKEIIIENRKATGVILESGEHLFADSVISNAGPDEVYLNLVKDETLCKPYIFKRKLLKPSISLLTLYIGLDTSGKNAGVSDRTTFVNHTYDNTVAFNNAMNENFDITDYIISDYTDENAGTHNKGAGIVQILEPANGAAWTDISRETYEDKKKKVIERILNKVSARFPRLKEHIKVLDLGTPRTMQLATRNPGGAVYGWAQSPDQADNWRFSGKSHIKDLYFTGAWARGGGGGYMGAIVNGRVTSHQVLLGHKKRDDIVHFDVVKPKTMNVIENVTETSSDYSLNLKSEIYTVIAEKDDISPMGELLPQSAIKILSSSADRYVEDKKHDLHKIWPLFNPQKKWNTTYFQMRFLFVPFLQLKPGDKLIVETSFIPKQSGKGEFTQNIYFKKDNKKVANAAGRVLVRV
ncbi:MAG: NAD(P)/FAD-dependent oxidoreductase [Deltaproteobacteria bacterium]|nr:NAD(P)/FAD-dependent oxidoreductase [Deltaproteobacteria bacterium]